MFFHLPAKNNLLFRALSVKLLHMRAWWNGRHVGLRSQCQKREGSSPFARTIRGTIMKTFTQIVHSLTFDDLTSITTDDVRVNIAAFARWIYMAHVGWPSFSPKIKKNFKDKIVQLYNHPPKAELGKKLNEILITTLPDNHCSVWPRLTIAEEKNIPNKVIDHYPSTSVGKTKTPKNKNPFS